MTVRDVEVLRWAGRHGVVSTEQIAERFWPAGSAIRTVRRRLSVLAEAGLLRADRPGWRQQSKLWLATARGLRWANVPLRPGRLVGWRLRHTLALVDLSEAARAIRQLAEYLERNPDAIVRGRSYQKGGE